MRFFLTNFYMLLVISVFAQGNRQMTMETFDVWNKIARSQISNDGNWVVYEVGNEAGDPTLHIYNNKTGDTVTFHRGKKAKISEDSQWLAFQLTTAVDTIRALKRRKVKKDELPNDSLVIYHLDNRTVHTVPDIKTFTVPKAWNGWLVYHKAFVKPKKAEKDTVEAILPPGQKPEKPKKAKKDDGTLLVYRELTTQATYSFPGVTEFEVAEKNPVSVFNNTGKFDGHQAGVYHFDFKTKTARPLYRQKGIYKKLVLDESGNQAAFLADLDTTTVKVRPLHLLYWKNGKDTARLVEATEPIPDGGQMHLSDHYAPQFSGDGKTLYYGMAPFPFLQDTNMLEEEIVNVEVWHYQDQRLHTQQKVDLKDDQKKTYLKAWHPASQKAVSLTNPRFGTAVFNYKKNGQYLLAIDDESTQQSSSWDGFPFPKQVEVVNQETGQRKLIAKNLRGNPQLSVDGKYAFWYNTVDTAWYAHATTGGQPMRLTDNNQQPFYDELNDRPMLPRSYGVMGWSKDDAAIYIYDRYDIWEINPQKPADRKRLTKGRETQTTYRWVQLDYEQPYVPIKSGLLLHYFNHQDKTGGYAHLSRNGKLRQLAGGDYRYPRNIKKAKNANLLIFAKENFQTFPDLELTDMDFKSSKKISDANPQQKDYGWGSIEIFKFTDLNGNELEGLLVKPPNFDPVKKYPMIVNFYERNSHNLHRHRAPYPHRSSINYSFYANRGYLVFNPDVPYRVGYPGESAYNSVMAGVTALIEKGFVDRERIGVQGHSWGGYQVAYLTTKTNLFKCAESGAPVVNMFSAYGGIRWRSGLSRMFQYENTQSRIGGTIWEYPIRYLENSPIFFLDKVETPLLILHNDKDGAVPWYQGIEYFVGLRRLGKPAWLLNYNDEPHWPVKRQNRLDFNRRMLQFFDYYLMDAKMPEWMQRGVPAMEKGIRQGY